MDKNKLYYKKLNCKINKDMVGFYFKVYIGNRFIRIQVNEKMVGFRFGEFVKTRKFHVFNKKK
jgi:ribosomal protein S19